MVTDSRSMARARKPTLDDVARSAGVSYQTVSRVVNRHPSVAEATRKRVLQAIKDLDYYPNRTARSLATRRSNTIGIVGFDTRFYGPAQMLVNIESVLKREGYGLAFTSIDDATFAAVQRASSEISHQDLDGIVMIAPLAGADVESITDLFGDTPLVMIDVTPGESVHSVAIDQAHGVHLAVKHLLDLGHRHVCEISGPLRWNDARERHETLRSALEAAGVEPGVSVESDWSAAGGFAAAKRLLATRAPCTALVAGNDQMALGAIRALREAGLRVPEDVSVVGFDDVPEAAYFDPPLTTVRQDFEILGRQCVEYLTTLIKAPRTPCHQRKLFPTFVTRSSTAEPRAAS
jgi:DNA-binding LacI/PurR family transcriptional regulator